MLYNRLEGQKYKQGINFTNTAYGHALVAVIGKLKLGYYWGKKLHSRIGWLNA